MTTAVSIGAGCASNSSPSRRSKVERAATSKPWCPAQQDAAWKKLLAGGLVSLSRNASVQPLAVADDGHSFYATLFSKDYSGIVKIDARTSRYTKIRRVPHADAYGAIGSTDERWLVWVDTTTNYWTKWTIWSWDSHTGRLRRIATTPRVPHAEEWSAASTPTVRDGYAVWAQGVGTGKTGVHVVDLASGKNKIIYRGRASEPFLLPGHVVVWAEDVGDFGAKKPDYVLRAASILSGKLVAPPVGVRDLSGFAASTFLSDGSGYLYAAGPWNSLWWSPSLRLAPNRVFVVPSDNPIDNSLDASGRYVYFGVQSRAYLADVDEGRYLQIGPGGSVRFGKTALVYSKPSTKKASRAIGDVIFLPLDSLPMVPACR